MARGKIPGFSKMKKKELCGALDKAKLLPREGGQAQVKGANGFKGVVPPEWDFDKLNPIPTFLLAYDYLYGAGSSINEIVRYFILPDDYPLVGIQLPSKDGKIPRLEFEFTVADYFDATVDPYATPTFNLDGEVVTAHRVQIKGLPRGAKGTGVNQIAPRIGSQGWNDLLAGLQIVGMEGDLNKDAELRREYQIITTPAIGAITV